MRPTITTDITSGNGERVWVVDYVGENRSGVGREKRSYEIKKYVICWSWREAVDMVCLFYKYGRIMRTSQEQKPIIGKRIRNW